MRILHSAEFRLGVGAYGDVDSAAGFSTRLIDVLRALDEPEVGSG